MRTVAMAILMAVLAFGVACKKSGEAAGGGGGGGGGGGDTAVCEAKSKCPNEGEPLAFVVDMCKEMLKAPTCVAEFRAQQQCMVDNEKCTEEGKNSAVLTSQACQPQIQAFGTCMAASAGGPATPPAPATP